MKKTIYIGARIEIADRFYLEDLDEKYNSKHKNTKIFDLNTNGKITIEKKDSMLIARGVKNDKYKSGVINFSAMIEMGNCEDIKRVAKIINVLGNDRLIKEKISVFVDKRSALNSIPELAPLSDMFKAIDAMVPGFIRLGWYYAPEIRI